MLVICQCTQLTQQTPCETNLFLCLYFIFYQNALDIPELIDSVHGLRRYLYELQSALQKRHKTCQSIQ